MERWKKVVQEGLDAGLHPGGQLCVLQHGKVVIDEAFGEARAGTRMTRESIVPWFSSGKPLTGVLVALLQERGELRYHDPVAKWIPDFGSNGKERITLWHLLTHTGGFRSADKISADRSWEDKLRAICATPLEEAWVPGEKAGYSTSAAWHLIGEIIQRITKRPFDEVLQAEVLEPAGMSNTWLRLPLAENRRYGEGIALMHETSGGQRVVASLQSAAELAECRPGSSARGPVRDLALFYDMLLNSGSAGARQILQPATVQELLRPHRTGMFDQTFMHTLDFGLGFILNSNRYGIETVPYGYGRHASDEAFGHSGAQSSCGFADPRHGLAVAWAFNGMPGERLHQKRQRELNSALYEDLELAA